jgi:hypothetical protein
LLLGVVAGVQEALLLLLMLLLQQRMHLQEAAGVAGRGQRILIRACHSMLCHDSLTLQRCYPGYIGQAKAHAAHIQRQIDNDVADAQCWPKHGRMEEVH